MSKLIRGEKRHPSGIYRAVVSWPNLGRTLARQSAVRLAAALGALVVTVSVAAALSPAASAFHTVAAPAGRLAALALWVLALWRLSTARRAESRSEERTFFTDLVVAFAFPLPLDLAELFAAGMEIPLSPFGALGRLLLVFGHCAALLLAVEYQPHRRHRWRSARLERGLVAPSIGVFLLGVAAYFFILPALLGRTTDPTSVVPLIFAVLVLFVGAKFLYLAVSAGQTRWRLIYAGLSMVLALDAGRLTGLLSGGPAWRVELGFAVAAAFLLVVIAQLRGYPLALPGERKLKADALEENLPGPSGQTLLQALLFPALHFFGYSFTDLFDAALRPPREVLVGWVLLVLGILAWLQNRLMERRTRELWSEHRRLSQKLLESEEDLRLMVEKRHAREAVEEWEERFYRVFTSLPDLFSLTTLEEGRFLEVNPGFLARTGWERHEVIGKTSVELGLWGSEARARILRRLAEGGKVRNEKIEFRTRSRELRRGRFSAEIVEFQERPVILTMVYEVEAVEE